MKKVLMSALLATMLHAAPLSVENAQKYVTSYTTMVTIYTNGLKTYTDSYNKYLALYNSTPEGRLKNAYLNSVVAAQNAITVYKSGLARYEKLLADAKVQLNESIAYYNPKPALIPGLVTSNVVTPKGIELVSQYSQVGIASAWAQGYTGKGITIADIDTGISQNNADVSRFLSNVIDIGTSIDPKTGVGTRTYLSYGQISDIATLSTTSSKKYSADNMPIITITGNGTGATAKAFLNSIGQIAGIQITNFGSGYTGNVSVVIKDSQGNIDNSYSLTPHIAGVDYNGHGTATATIIAGAVNNTGTAGVAFDANLIVIKAGDTGINTNDAIDGLKMAITKGAQIVNQSYGSYTAISSKVISEYQKALASGITIVNAAGNEGSSCATTASCNSWATLPLNISNVNTLPGAYIVAGALNDAGDDIASYSNRAGITKNFYILAPGTVTTENLKGSIVVSRGTSFASPIVAGTMALLKQKWPQLSSAQQAQILFQTADDMGTIGVDEIYGWGKLNVTTAFSPIGTGKIPNIQKSVAGLSTRQTYSTNLNTSITGSTMLTGKLASLDMTTITFDDYNREFTYSLNANINGTVQQFAFTEDQFFEMPLSNGFSIGYNSTYYTVDIAYKSGKNKFSYAYLDSFLGTQGSGALGYDGHTHYLGYQYSNLGTELTGVSSSFTLGYAIAKNNKNSNIAMSNAFSLGNKTKVLYKGFGLVASIPGVIASGSITTNLPTSVNDGETIVYTKQKQSLVGGDFERSIGLTYCMNGLVVEADKTFNASSIKGVESNNVKISYNTYF